MLAWRAGYTLSCLPGPLSLLLHGNTCADSIPIPAHGERGQYNFWSGLLTQLQVPALMCRTGWNPEVNGADRASGLSWGCAVAKSHYPDLSPGLLISAMSSYPSVSPGFFWLSANWLTRHPADDTCHNLGKFPKCHHFHLLSVAYCKLKAILRTKQSRI